MGQEGAIGLWKSRKVVMSSMTAVLECATAMGADRDWDEQQRTWPAFSPRMMPDF
jgi:hypothetical protein